MNHFCILLSDFVKCQFMFSLVQFTKHAVVHVYVYACIYMYIYVHVYTQVHVLYSYSKQKPNLQFCSYTCTYTCRHTMYLNCTCTCTQKLPATIIYMYLKYMYILYNSFNIHTVVCTLHLQTVSMASHILIQISDIIICSACPAPMAVAHTPSFIQRSMQLRVLQVSCPRVSI